MATALPATSLPPASFFNKGQLRTCYYASIPPSQSNLKRFRVRALKEKTEETKSPSSSPPSSSASAEEITKKYGLEAGLWKIFGSKEGGEGVEGGKSKGNQAKELLAKYGGAYLATSITLSLISFSLCYVLISAGIDVPALLQKASADNEAFYELQIVSTI